VFSQAISTGVIREGSIIFHGGREEGREGGREGEREGRKAYLRMMSVQPGHVHGCH